MDMGSEEERVERTERVALTYNIPPCVNQMPSRQLVGSCYSRKPSSALCDALEGRMRGERETEEGGDIHIHMVDSRCCIAETNTRL